jgi:D-alanine-D-alanine ligase
VLPYGQARVEAAAYHPCRRSRATHTVPQGLDGGSMEKLRVGLLFGGRSVEHDVSVMSATSILAALDRSRYEISLVGVDAEGGWHLMDADAFEADEGASLSRVLSEPVVILPATSGPTQLRLASPTGDSDSSTARESRLDVVFPMIHGRGGEDGALQGLLESAGVAYVGSGVLSSALQMDKDFAKQLLAQAGLPVTPWITFSGGDLDRDGVPAAAELAESEIGFPAYVKPANSGSSIGISRVETRAELTAAIADARRYDRKVIVEASVEAREVEVAVLGNDDPEASVVGEIRTTQAFYDYDAKYRDDATELIIPAELDEDLSDTLRASAVEAYRALGAEGMARVDFLLERETNRFFVNELNSLPGFTSESSMYPKLWEAKGLSYPELLDRLIELALERHSHQAKLETHTPPPLSSRNP